MILIASVATVVTGNRIVHAGNRPLLIETQSTALATAKFEFDVK